ncbi:hypothetical protein C2S51_026165 [Perilla frutescens var. frutescens]|nr:hypothetical protein C2S51_026165 [Perilla frutescens var. frutescens]
MFALSKLRINLKLIPPPKKSDRIHEAFGFKKDVMQFLTCLRNIRFDFRCFGYISAREIASNDDEEDDGDEDLNEEEKSGAVFSKWFMILQEDNLSKEFIRAEESGKRKVIVLHSDEGLVVVDDDASGAPPPPNALLIMRCRSVLVKSWLEEREEDDEGERSDHESEEHDGKLI